MSDNLTEQDILSTNVLNSTNDAIIAIDNSYRIVLINPAAQIITGLSSRQASQHNILNMFKGQDDIIYLIKTAMTENRSISDRETIQLQRQNALPLPVSVNASPLYTNSGAQEGIILTLHDVSNIRQLEQDNQRAEQLGMLETLAAGLAHEVKNPLGGIRGAAQLLSMELDQRDDLLEYTQVMIKETDRINGIIEELMDLTSPRVQEMSAVNLTKTINDIVLLQAQSDLGKEIHFNLQLDPSIPPIKGDQTLLTRLFLNLIKNATEAIESNGTITILIRMDSEHHLTRPGHAAIPFVLVKIIDNGPGINDNILQKIFTPFYTTKNNGSGLGLAISQKIVTDHNGLLRIENTNGQGTCCSVYLPFLSAMPSITNMEL